MMDMTDKEIDLSIVLCSALVFASLIWMVWVMFEQPENVDIYRYAQYVTIFGGMADAFLILVLLGARKFNHWLVFALLTAALIGTLARQSIGFENSFFDNRVFIFSNLTQMFGVLFGFTVAFLILGRSKSTVLFPNNCAGLFTEPKTLMYAES